MRYGPCGVWAVGLWHCGRDLFALTWVFCPLQQLKLPYVYRYVVPCMYRPSTMLTQRRDDACAGRCVSAGVCTAGPARAYGGLMVARSAS